MFVYVYDLIQKHEPTKLTHPGTLYVLERFCPLSDICGMAKLAHQQAKPYCSLVILYNTYYNLDNTINYYNYARVTSSGQILRSFLY